MRNLNLISAQSWIYLKLRANPFIYIAFLIHVCASVTPNSFDFSDFVFFLSLADIFPLRYPSNSLCQVCLRNPPLAEFVRSVESLLGKVRAISFPLKNILLPRGLQCSPPVRLPCLTYAANAIEDLAILGLFSLICH